MYEYVCPSCPVSPVYLYSFIIKKKKKYDEWSIVWLRKNK